MNDGPEALVRQWQERAERALERWLPPENTHPVELHQAMRYGALGGGKRLRPILVYATGHTLGLEPRQLDGTAAAIEMIHAYSLIHDDLPAMDDDDLRRGRPTCHKVYGEAMAILAGDAMQALAFWIIAHDHDSCADARTRLKMIETLAQACGSRGMAGGQAIDLRSVGRGLDIAELEDMHVHKTGLLIRASVVLAAMCAGQEAGGETLERLDRYARKVGLAFQIRDDILDEEGDTATLGKQAGADRARDKPTYPRLLGLDEARTLALELRDEALRQIESFDERAGPLRWIARYIVERRS